MIYHSNWLFLDKSVQNQPIDVGLRDMNVWAFKGEKQPKQVKYYVILILNEIKCKIVFFIHFTHDDNEHVIAFYHNSSSNLSLSWIEKK